MWVSRKRFKELEERCSRIERILNFSIDGKITYIFDPLDPGKCNVYIDKKEYSFNIPSYLRIYYLDKIDESNIVKIKCFDKDNNLIRRYYIVDLDSGKKIEISSEDLKI